MYSTSGRIDLQSIVKETRATRHSGGYLGHCPAHRDRTPSLSIGSGEGGKLLLKCHAGCEFTQILQALGIADGDARISPLSALQTATDDRKSERAVKRIWNDTALVQPGDPVDRYLRRTRGLALDEIPLDLRFHSDLDFWMQKAGPDPDDPFPFECVGSYPAMVAAVRNLDGKLVGIHRTYLTSAGEKLRESRDGRLIEKPRKQRSIFAGATRGGAIRLGEMAHLGLVGEGIETCLAASLMSSIPAWAGMTAGGVEHIELPERVLEVVICVENDSTSEKSAKRLAKRLMREGRLVSYAPVSALTNVLHADWADVARSLNNDES